VRGGAQNQKATFTSLRALFSCTSLIKASFEGFAQKESRSYGAAL